MYYERVPSRYGNEYEPVGNIGTKLKKTRRKYEDVRRIHRTIRRAFATGCTLILSQFPFSFLGSEALHVSTSILGGLLVLIPGSMLAFHYGTGEGLPNLNEAREAYEDASELYTKQILAGGNDDVG